MIYDLLSALNADKSENKCGTVIVKLLCLIASYSCYIKCVDAYIKLIKGSTPCNLNKVECNCQHKYKRM